MLRTLWSLVAPFWEGGSEQGILSSLRAKHNPPPSSLWPRSVLILPPLQLFSRVTCPGKCFQSRSQRGIKASSAKKKKFPVMGLQGDLPYPVLAVALKASLGLNPSESHFWSRA